MQGNPSSVTRKMSSHVLPDGQKLHLCSFGMYQWSAVKEAALDYYKRNHIRTWTKHADLLPEHMREAAIERAFRDVQNTTILDLPPVVVQVPALDDDGNVIRKPVLDKEGNVIPGAVGDPILVDRELDYASWWMSQIDGSLYCLWLSATMAPGQQHLTERDVSEMFAMFGSRQHEEIDKAAATLSRIGRLDEDLSKNSSPPPQNEAEGTMTPGMTQSVPQMN